MTLLIFFSSFVAPSASSPSKQSTKDTPAIRILTTKTAKKLAPREQSAAAKKHLNSENRHPEAIKEFIHSLRELQRLLGTTQANDVQKIETAIHVQLID